MLSLPSDSGGFASNFANAAIIAAMSVNILMRLYSDCFTPATPTDSRHHMAFGPLATIAQRSKEGGRLGRGGLSRCESRRRPGFRRPGDFDQIVGEMPFLKGDQVIEVAVEPVFTFIGHEEYRHPVMDRLDRCIRAANCAGIDRSHALLSRHSPPQAKVGWSLRLNQVRVNAPLTPSGSAQVVIGIRHRHCGLRARPTNMFLLRSAMLLTGLGLAVGFIVRSRSGNPHVIDCMMRWPSLSRTTTPG